MSNKNETSPLFPILVLSAITLICLLPFATRAFNIDEPLFLWAARHIQTNPLDFYGFTVNWYGHDMLAADVIKNPPLSSYYIALVAALAGFNELPLHLAFILPALAVVLGTYALAREFTLNPLTAACLALLNPVFIISSTSVMCDTMMVAFYVWAVYFWVRGTKTANWLQLLLSSALVALCALTKYFGISLIPLLFLYSMLGDRKRRPGALFLLVPVAILGLYQWQTLMMYHRGLLSDAAQYAQTTKNTSGMIPCLVMGLSFTGGCFITLLFPGGMMWNRRKIAAAALFVPIAAFLLKYVKYPHLPPEASWPYFLHISVFVAAGIALMAITASDLWRHRDPDSLLLSLWVAGTFLFASVVNWSVNGRSVLPMAPAAAILVVRALERRRPATAVALRQLALPLCCAFALSMAVTWADATQAGTVRSAAAAVAADQKMGKHPWFQGHWGFQYYMQQNGGIPYNKEASLIRRWDKMVVPENNTNLSRYAFSEGSRLQVLTYPGVSFLSTMSGSGGAGFYSDRYGPVPFVFGDMPPERYHLLMFDHEVPPNG